MTWDEKSLKTEYKFFENLLYYLMLFLYLCWKVDASKHTLAKYLMELTIIEYDMVQYNPSQIAAAALCLSMKLLDGSKWVSYMVAEYLRLLNI